MIDHVIGNVEITVTVILLFVNTQLLQLSQLIFLYNICVFKDS